MGSTFFGLNVALSGVMAQQRALDTVSHNVTNASTEGYTRQRVEFATNDPIYVPAWNRAVTPGQIGTGVQIGDHVRLRDQFIDSSLRSSMSTHSEFDARSSSLASIDTVINEPGEFGIQSLLSEFWASWQGLSAQPESSGAREAVRGATRSLAEGITNLRSEMTTAIADADLRIGLQVGEVNTIAAQINALNTEIAKVVSVGDQPNDLRDQRDLLVDNLSKLTDISVTESADGKISVGIGGQLLVDSSTDTVSALAIDAAGAATVGGVGTTIDDGSLRGLVDVRNTVVGGTGGFRDRLDTFAAALIGTVNTAHAAGFGLDGSTGNALFAGTDASDIAVSAAVIGSLDAISAASAAGDLPGGSDNAVAIAQLQFTTQTIGAQTTTIDGYYQGLVSSVGLEADQSARLAAVQQGVMEAARERRESVSGVNIDEEIADMIRFQKSFNAAARMMTTVDEMLDLIVNRLGLVGR